MKGTVQLPNAFWVAILLVLGLLAALQTSLRVGRAISTVQDNAAPCSKPSAEKLLRKLQLELDKAGVKMNSEQSYLFDSLYVQAHVSSERFKSAWAVEGAARVPPQRRRGILMLAAGRDTSLNAAVNILLMRGVHKSRLPLEVVYYGDKERYPPLEALLKDLNSSTAPTWYIDGNQVVEEMRGQLSHHRSDAPLGYATKVHALAYVTRFREVLMVDSDCTLLVRPEDMFDIPEYQQSGNLFWPDYWGLQHPTINLAAYTRHGLNVSNFTEAESGQVLLDRVRYKDVLEWLWYLNSHQNIVYQNMLGDKDTYRLAFHLAGKGVNYTQVQQPALSALNGVIDATNVSVEWRGMVQLLPNGQLAAHHRTWFTKWFPGYAQEERLRDGHVTWITGPITENQMKVILSRWGWTGDYEMENTAWQRVCRQDRVDQVNVALPEVCNFTGVATGDKYWVAPTWLLGRNVAQVLNASVEVVRQVKKLAGDEADPGSQHRV